MVRSCAEGPPGLAPDREFWPRDVHTGEPVDLRGLHPCGVGTRGVVVVTLVSKARLGVFTDHPDELARALESQLSPSTGHAERGERRDEAQQSGE